MSNEERLKSDIVLAFSTKSMHDIRVSWDNKALSSFNTKQGGGIGPIILILQDLHALLSHNLRQLDKIIR